MFFYNKFSWFLILSYFKLYVFFFSEPAQGRDDLCPRLNGFYAHPDPAVCHIFYACVDGEATEYTCSSGLWYDEYTGTCNWPKDTERKTCSNKAYGENININININMNII